MESLLFLRHAARRLGFAYLDTGAAYRAVAWHVLNETVDPSDEAAVIECWKNLDMSSVPTLMSTLSMSMNRTSLTLFVSLASRMW